MDNSDGADEAVAFADDCFQEARLLWIVGKRRANFANNVVDTFFGVDEKSGAPEFCDNVFAGNELVAPVDEEDQQVHRFFFELDAMAGAAELIAPKIELEVGNSGWLGRHESLRFGG